MSVFYLTDTIPTEISSGDYIDCPYSGSGIPFTLPPGTFLLQVWGAQGGNYSDSLQGGCGGYSSGTLTLTEETNIYIYVGGQPTDTAGGFNGGGASGGSSWFITAQGGGGGTDIRVGQDSLYNRIIVAGGGGGHINLSNSSDDYSLVKCGGGLIGGIRSSNAYAGTQTSAGTNGSFGVGADGRSLNWMYTTAGGGGGWYGGGSPSNSDDIAANDGGSGYVFTESTARYYPISSPGSEYYLTDAETIGGNQPIYGPDGRSTRGRQGNGYARIIVLSLSSNFPFRTKMSGGWIEFSSGYAKVNGTWKQINSVYTKKNDTWIPC